MEQNFFLSFRDASWELEENAFGDLLQVYQHCDALKCFCEKGRNYSAQSK